MNLKSIYSIILKLARFSLLQKFSSLSINVYKKKLYYIYFQLEINNGELNNETIRMVLKVYSPNLQHPLTTPLGSL